LQNEAIRDSRTYCFTKLYKDVGTTDPTINPLIGILAIFLKGDCVRRIVEVFANQTKDGW
jgi:hypothetical protein